MALIIFVNTKRTKDSDINECSTLYSTYYFNRKSSKYYFDVNLFVVYYDQLIGALHFIWCPYEASNLAKSMKHRIWPKRIKVNKFLFVF